ncbi:GNAT family N-acetyltransferase [Helcococcus kunzii]|uniref:N-acetyltransferase domain-containing protein n=1 Tax=Helcococcus kunzii ATCC 51366 TaxID=883114 RepID=H3NNN2_9FIRM|nr:GNAT family N-acetyltransferase [Helcococcus kunzii]EHR34007.1 hypothetical protein HMPREF9709_00943 [Helcococcus kunzii ATCC 51366]MCT1795615.1 GNAT family N-acetyltransferase [Helcococcus kunzii]MCT1988819.1 GNAT family N-acetyltransferase [Helcococcus kunzii]QUY64857.1 GNAT family N-acetyltransferase [Helcococcus kunzii]QZO77299.1 GNAT family N-acetyltransferase [Helcococcus kunzii]
MNINIDISNKLFNTERLKLRPWELTDLEDFYEYSKVDGVGQMAGWLPHKNIQESRNILEHFIKNKNVLAIEYNGKVIGSIGLHNYNEKKWPEFENLKCKEIGYVLSKDYWGLGIMPEAVKEIIRYMFEDEKLDILFCGYFKFNSQSKRVQEKCGFTYYSDQEITTLSGITHDGVINILRKEDWIK